MKKEIIQPKEVEVPKGPYSQAIKVRGNNLLFVSGQTPLDAQGKLIGKGDPIAQSRQVMYNLKLTLEAAGGTLGDIVKTTVYLTDLKYFQAVSDIRREYFGDKYPASTLLVVNQLYREDIYVEIDAIAVLD